MSTETAMTTLSDRDTGLGEIRVNVMPGRGMRHGPRVKVSNVPNTFDPKDNFSLDFEGRLVAGKVGVSKASFTKVALWVLQNRNALQQIWDRDDLGGREHIKLVKKLKLFGHGD